MIGAVSAIQLATFSLKTAKEALTRLRSHYEKCNSLVNRCQILVSEACCFLVESPRSDNLEAELKVLMSVCEKVRSLVTDIADKGTTWKLLNQAAITQTITETESELDYAYTIFKVSAHNQNDQLQQDFAIALRQDNKRIKLFLETLLHNHRQMVDTGRSALKQSNPESTGEAPAANASWMIVEKQIELCTTPNVLGSGEIGRVYTGNLGSRAIVMKQIHSEVAQKLLANTKRRKLLESRIESWTQMQHPHLAEFIGASLELTKPFFVVKFYPFGNVLDYIQSYPTRNRLSILHHASLGMQFLHSRNIIHANLKPGNLLVDSNHYIVITDYQIPQKRHSHAFSTSRPQGRYTYHRRSLPYVAPERFDNAELALAADVYSFAMIGWEVCTGLVPFTDVDPACFYETVVVQRKRPGKADSIDSTLWTHMQGWWKHDPTTRPQFSSIEGVLREFVGAKIHARQAKRKTSSGKRVRLVEGPQSATASDGPRANRERSLSPAPLRVVNDGDPRTADRRNDDARPSANLTHNRRPSKAERVLGEIIPPEALSDSGLPSSSAQKAAHTLHGLARRNSLGRRNPDTSARRQSILAPVRRLPSEDQQQQDSPRPIVVSPVPRKAGLSHNDVIPMIEASAKPSPPPDNGLEGSNGPPVSWFLLPRPELDTQEMSSRIAASQTRIRPTDRPSKKSRPVPPQPPNTPEPLAISVYKQIIQTSELAPGYEDQDVPATTSSPGPQLKPDKPEAILSPVRRQPTVVRQKEMIMQAFPSPQPVYAPAPIALSSISEKPGRKNSTRRNLPQPPTTTPVSLTPERGRTPDAPSQTISGRRGLPDLPDLPLPAMAAAVPVRVLTPDLPSAMLMSRQDLQNLPYPVMSATLMPERPLTPDMPQVLLDMTPRRPSHRVQRLEVSDSARQAIAFSLHALMNPVTFHNLIRNILICYPDWLKNTKQGNNRNPHAPHVYKDRAKSHVITFETILTMTTWATGPSDVTDSVAGVNGCRILIYVLAACSMAELAHRERPGHPYLFVPKFVDKVMSKPAFQNMLEDLAQDLWAKYGSKLSTSTQAVAELPTALEDCIEQLINDYAPLLT